MKLFLKYFYASYFKLYRNIKMFVISITAARIKYLIGSG